MEMKRIRPKNYYHIKLLVGGKKHASWFWVIKIADKGLLGFPAFKRVRKDGDTIISEKTRKDGTIISTRELIIGKVIEEHKAVMNLHYAELERE